MYKLIAVDLDGTLLDSQRNISEKNKRAIRDVLAAGKLFTVSTGRPLQGVTELIELLDADLPIILYNGAMAATTRSGRILYESPLPGPLAEEAVRMGQERDVTVLVWANGELHVSGIDGHVREYAAALKSVLHPKVVEDLGKIAAGGVTKVLWRGDPKKIAEYEKEAAAHFKGRLNCHTSVPMLLEFVDIKASKAAAMQRIGEHYHIARSEMIAVGDGFNDLSMIRWAGLGVAMGNAVQEIKDQADEVTLTNDEDGVAAVIYRHML